MTSFQFAVYVACAVASAAALVKFEVRTIPEDEPVVLLIAVATFHRAFLALWIWLAIGAAA